MTFIVPTLHPAHLLRGASVDLLIASDIRKAMRIAADGAPSLVENLVPVHPSNVLGTEGIVRLALQWMDRWLHLKCPLGVDVETSSLSFIDCKLYSIGISGEDGHNTAVAFTLADFHTLPYEAEIVLDHKLRQLLSDPHIPLVYHNAPFDQAVLKRKGFVLEGKTWDTMGLWHLIQPDIPSKTLDTVAQTWLDVPPWKIDHDEGKKQRQTRDPLKLLVYNARDALYTALSRSHCVEEIFDRGMSQELIDYQMAFAELATDMEIWGVPVNMHKRAERGQQYQARMQALKQQMREHLGWPDFNPNSPIQAREALYGRKYLNLPVTKHTETDGDPSTSYHAIIDHIENPFVYAFIKHAELKSIWGTQYRDQDAKGKMGAFFKEIRWDGRSEHGTIYHKWNPCGTKGSRYSSSPNAQNIRKKDRDIYEAPPGWVFVGADKDQLELRIIACRAGVRELVLECSDPAGDPHRLAAMNAYPDFTDRNPEEQGRLRDMVKNVVYASLYNAGVTRVWETLRENKKLPAEMRAALTKPTVRHIYNSYFGRYVEIPTYHNKNYDQACKEFFNECEPLKRRRFFPSQPPPFTEVGNWKTQTEGSDHVGREMVWTQAELKSRYPGRASIIIHAHDQLVAMCHENIADDVKNIVDHYFGDTAIEGPAGIVHLTAKAKIGKTLLAIK